LRLWGEILSGQRVLEGGGVTNQSPGDWIERWHATRKLQPNLGYTAAKLAPVTREGSYWYAQGRMEQQKYRFREAIVAFRKALELGHDLADLHYSLGNALRDHGEPAEAVLAFRRAIDLSPQHPEAHCNLGQLLRRQGEFAEALTMLRKGHALGTKTSNWKYPSAQWVKDCERSEELDAKLPHLLSGEIKPADKKEHFEYALLCAYKQTYSAATRLYREALALPAAKAENVSSHRYNAACCGALAGCGLGKDASSLSEKDRAALRSQALAWLQIELTNRKKTVQSNAKQATIVRNVLERWLRDPDLSCVRNENALDQLPESERVLWRQFWIDVAAVSGSGDVDEK
jgi:tetratricopeptide (TPR) repeat protein